MGVFVGDGFKKTSVPEVEKVNELSGVFGLREQLEGEVKCRLSGRLKVRGFGNVIKNIDIERSAGT